MKATLISIVISALLLLTTSFSFAQDRYPPEQVKGSIVFYTHWGHLVKSGDMARWVKAFKEKYPHVDDVQVHPIGSYAKIIATRLATGDYGDVLEISAQTMPNEQLGDFFLPLNDMALSDKMHFAGQWRYQDKEYAYTFGSNVEAVVYNKDAFAKAGITDVPQTRTQLFAAAEKLKKAGIIPYVSNIGTGWALAVFDGLAEIISGDPDFTRQMLQDKTPFAASHPFGQSYGLLREFVDRGLTEDDITTGNWDRARGWMASGKAGMWYLGNWSINQVVNEGAKSQGLKPISLDKIGFFPLPYNDSGHYNIRMSPDYAMAVSKHTKNPLLAKAWVDFLLTKTELSQQEGLIPGYKEFAPTLPQLKEVMSYQPTLISPKPADSEFTEAMHRIGLINGSGTRDLMYEKDYPAAIERLNRQWVNAVKRIQR